ncbi:MAG: nitroreductase [Thermoplasmata archaeon]|nr:nitroreductase [Thermoplasmata archaeon]
MHLDGPPSKTIRARRSVRNYSPEDISPDLLRQLNEACADTTRSPFGEVATFQIIEKPFKRGEPVKLGNYGLQRNPRYFFVGTISQSPTALLGYGYLLEHLVLRATELGLGTCWMGYFNKEFFPEVSGDGLCPTIAIVGVPEKPRMGEKLIRIAIKADNRKEWEHIFFDRTFDRPLSRSEAGEYTQPLEMLRLAPSSANTQPWRIVRGPGNVFHFHMHIVKKRYHAKGMHHIDTGIAMAHFELASRESGLDGEWKVEDPRLSLPKGTEYLASWFPK